MEIIKFIKWQWNIYEKWDKLFILVILVSISASVVAYIAGNTAPVVALAGAITLIVCLVIGTICQSIGRRWDIYVAHRDSREANEIIHIPASKSSRNGVGTNC